MPPRRVVRTGVAAVLLDGNRPCSLRQAHVSRPEMSIACDRRSSPTGRLARTARRTPSRPSARPRTLGADWVELDVRRTADGALAVHHDAAPARRPRRSSTLRAADLPATCPLLAAALDACAGMGVNVEIKNSPDDPTSTPTRRLAEPRSSRPSPPWRQPVLVSSLRPRDPRPGAGARPGGRRPRCSRSTSSDPATAIARCVGAGPRGAAPASTRTVDAGRSVAAAHAAGLVGQRRGRSTTPPASPSWPTWGVDGICTNVPDIARSGADARRLGGAIWRESTIAASDPAQSARQHGGDVGLVAEVEAVGLAEVVAVDLVRERAVALDRELVEVGAVRRGACWRRMSPPQPSAAPTIRSERARTPACGTSRPRGPGRASASGDQVERPVAEVRVRVRVEADREVAVVDDRAVGVVHREAGPAAVVVAEPGGERRRRRTAGGRRSA